MLTKATYNDLDELDDLAVLVITDMKKSNIPQWEYRYPRKEHFQKDVEKEGLFLVKQDDIIVGAIVILPENDPPYQTISSWICEHSVVLHRILVHPNYRQQGIAQQMFDFAEEYARKNKYQSIKIDTHLENYKMRRFLQKNKYIKLEYLAVIDRIAYEKVLEDTHE